MTESQQVQPVTALAQMFVELKLGCGEQAAIGCSPFPDGEADPAAGGNVVPGGDRVTSPLALWYDPPQDGRNQQSPVVPRNVRAAG